VKQYKEEFEIMTKKLCDIREEKEKVSKKVKKSRDLLNNLSSEKERWSETSLGFKEQLSSMTGDVMLSAAFLSYCGFFDKIYRNLMQNTWKQYLTEAKLKFNELLSIPEFLSKASDRIISQSQPSQR
jgi:dynein heavy chain 1